MAFSKKEMRKIFVNNTEYYWKVKDCFKTVDDIFFDVTFKLLVLSACKTKKVEAQFYGTGVVFVFDNTVQDIVITPKVVREIILRAEHLGWTNNLMFEYAEKTFPDAIQAYDKADTEITAAAQKWFVPYPGKKALENSFQQHNGDTTLMAEEFEDISVSQIEHWLSLLEIKISDALSY